MLIDAGNFRRSVIGSYLPPAFFPVARASRLRTEMAAIEPDDSYQTPVIAKPKTLVVSSLEPIRRQPVRGKG
jgi:hypothetical protein